MTNEESNLLRVVLNQPDDDAPRRAYAEWLGAQKSDSEQARSRFIHTQLDLASETAELSWGTRLDLQFEIGQALRKHHSEWASSLSPWVGPDDFYRGFIERVTINASEFLSRFAEISSLAPIRHVNIPPQDREAKNVLSSPVLQSILSLRVDRCELTDDDIRALAFNPAATELRWLSVQSNHLGFEAAQSMASSPYLKNLYFCDFSGNPVDVRDTYSQDNEFITGTSLTPDGALLERWHGPIPWLHYHSDTVDALSPNRFRLQPKSVPV